MRQLRSMIAPRPASIPDASVQSLVLVGTGSPQNVRRALAAMRQRFRAAHITLIIRRKEKARFAAAELDQVIYDEGLLELARLRRSVREADCDVKVVLLTGEGQNVRKLASFLLPAQRMLVFTEGGGVFWWGWDDRRAIWNHVRWRLGAARPPAANLQRVAAAIITPVLSFVAFVGLLLWHLRLNIRIRLWPKR